ncbi:MAG: SPFH domain-containing protein, partial [Sphingomicrobium sp.]
MTDSNFALNSSRERLASTTSGYLPLIVLLVAIVAQVWGISTLVRDQANLLSIAVTVAAPVILLFVASGFYMLQPNQAAAITLFGDYKGTDRATGLRWV